MFESCVLGVDPGLSALGLAAVARRDRRPHLLEARTVRTSRDAPEGDRLKVIHEAVADAIQTHRPHAVAVERVAWNTNQRTAMQVARATGVVVLAASEAGLPVEEYGPLEVKMAVTGQGNAAKGQIRDALARLHGLEGVPAEVDAADAVAVALCHLTQSRLRRAEGESRRSRRVDVTRLRG
jgi:crossover junction endodeoxyribonuclease RuvC